MAKVYDVVAVTGKYTDRNGNEKNRYMTCGAVFQTDKGMSLKLEALPIGHDGWFQLYEPKEREQPQGRQQSRRPAADDFNDSVPF
jgi:hypothetical protein